MLNSLRHRLRTSSAAWHVINCVAKLKYRASHNTLAAAGLEAVQDLKESGIAVKHLTDFFPTAFWEELRNIAEARWQSHAVQVEVVGRGNGGGSHDSKKKGVYRVELWPGAHELNLLRPFIRLSLSPEILGVVNGYLGILSKFREFFLQATLPMLPGSAPMASQRWACRPG